MQDDIGYGSLIGRIRTSVQTYIRTLITLGKQEVTEIVTANLRAALWFVAALVSLLLVPVALVILVIALIALALPLWAAALVTLVLFAVLGAALAYIGYRKLVLRGPDRTISQVKETVRWVRTRLLKQSESS